MKAYYMHTYMHVRTNIYAHECICACIFYHIFLDVHSYQFKQPDTRNLAHKHSYLQTCSHNTPIQTRALGPRTTCERIHTHATRDARTHGLKWAHAHTHTNAFTYTGRHTLTQLRTQGDTYSLTDVRAH